MPRTREGARDARAHSARASLSARASANSGTGPVSQGPQARLWLPQGRMAALRALRYSLDSTSSTRARARACLLSVSPSSRPACAGRD